MVNNLPRTVGRGIGNCVFLNSDIIMPVSNYIMERFKVLLAPNFDLRDRFSVVPMGTDVDKFKPDHEHGQEMREKYSLDTNGILLGYLGRLDDKKGVEFLIRGMDLLIKDGHNVKAFIGGTGPLREQLSELAFDA